MNPPTSLPDSPARALLVTDHWVLSSVVELALNHGTYTTRVVLSRAEAALVLLDQTRRRSERIPIVALTRGGDLMASISSPTPIPRVTRLVSSTTVLARSLT